MTNPCPQDGWQQWLSPDLFSGIDMQGSRVSSGARRLNHPMHMHDRFADHASLQPNARNKGVRAVANEETGYNSGTILYDVVWKFTNNKRKGVKDTQEGLTDHPAVLWDGSLQASLKEALTKHNLQDEQPVDTTVTVSALPRLR